MTGLLVLVLLLTGMFWWGLTVGEDRKDRSRERERPYSFRWECPDCGWTATIRCPSIDAMPGAEAMAQRAHICRSH